MFYYRALFSLVSIPDATLTNNCHVSEMCNKDNEKDVF